MLPGVPLGPWTVLGFGLGGEGDLPPDSNGVEDVGERRDGGGGVVAPFPPLIGGGANEYRDVFLRTRGGD